MFNLNITFIKRSDETESVDRLNLIVKLSGPKKLNNYIPMHQRYVSNYLNIRLNLILLFMFRYNLIC